LPHSRPGAPTRATCTAILRPLVAPSRAPRATLQGSSADTVSGHSATAMGTELALPWPAWAPAPCGPVPPCCHRPLLGGRALPSP
jgi:hypothetical protein